MHTFIALFAGLPQGGWQRRFQKGIYCRLLYGALQVGFAGKLSRLGASLLENSGKLVQYGPFASLCNGMYSGQAFRV